MRAIASMLLLRRQLLNHFAYPTTGDPTRTQPRDFSSISFRIHSTTQTAGAAEAEVPRPRARACARRARTQSAPDARSGRVRARARGEARGLRAKQRKEPPTSNRRGRLRRPECVVRAYSKDRTDDITVVVGFRQSQNKDAAVPATAKSTALTTKGKAWTLAMGFLSGFLGGLCGIRGPPIIMYFLHSPLQMSKKEQKGNGVAITAANVLVRVIVYAFKSALDEGHSQFESGDLPLYLVVLIASVGGVAVGQDIFQVLKDSQATIKTMLCFLLLLCGISLALATAM